MNGIYSVAITVDRARFGTISTNGSVLRYGKGKYKRIANKAYMFIAFWRLDIRSPRARYTMGGNMWVGCVKQ